MYLCNSLRARYAHDALYANAWKVKYTALIYYYNARGFITRYVYEENRLSTECSTTRGGGEFF